jgi:hypothetical protein
MKNRWVISDEQTWVISLERRSKLKANDRTYAVTIALHRGFFDV